MEWATNKAVDELTIRPIGHVRTCYPEKFGVPRQAGLVPAATGELVFEPGFRKEEAVRGLEGFSHLWLTFVFHLVPDEEPRLSVRPPRLGGNERVGVFATRSPFRPNKIGLSAVRLLGICHEGAEAPVLQLGGVDLVDGTPVLDVRPYLPYADAIPDAEGGFAGAAPAKVPVVVDPACEEAFGELPGALRELVLATLALDPRPGYHDEEGRPYTAAFADRQVTWAFGEGKVRILAIR